jgi:hypothetical protein
MSEMIEDKWGVWYLTDKGRPMVLEKLFLCNNCEVLEEQVRQLCAACERHFSQACLLPSLSHVNLLSWLSLLPCRADTAQD